MTLKDVGMSLMGLLWLFGMTCGVLSLAGCDDGMYRPTNTPQIVGTTTQLIKATDGKVTCYKFYGYEGMSCVVNP